MQNAIHPADDIGSVYETNVNNAVETVATCFSGASAPGTTYACQLWADTTNNILKQRDKTNSSWVTIGALGSSIMGLVPDLNATASGSSNAFAVTVNGLYSLTAGIKVWFKANFSITGAPTLNMNGGGAVAIYKFTASGRVSVAVPDIISGQWVCVMYDGTYWIMISEVAKWDYLTVPAISVYLGQGSQTPNTLVKVQFDTKIYDNQSEYDNVTNYRYTAKFAGIYSVHAGLHGSATTGMEYTYIGLFINGNQWAQSISNQPWGGNTSMAVATVEWTGRLDVGNYIEIYGGVQGSTGLLFPANTGHTVLQITKIG
jgi:hypothetical protein